MLRYWRQRIDFTDILVWGIGLSIGLVVVVGTIATLQSGKYSLATWLDLTITGLALGGIYALIALGYTLVYGILRMINFAHSEVFMSGPFVAVFLANGLVAIGFWDRYPLISLLLVTVLAAAVSATIAFLLERIAYRPLRGAPRLVPLITAIGASFFLQYTFRGLFGSGFQAYPTIKILDGHWLAGGLRILKFHAVAIGAAALLMGALYFFV